MVNIKKIYQPYLESLLLGKRKECEEYVRNLLNQQVDFKLIYEDLFKQSLYDVGFLWENNKISVAVEHLATSITGYLMNLIYPYLFSDDKNDKKAVVSNIANEHHQIGGRMVADLFEYNKWNAYYLGANTPSKDLISFIDEEKPDVVGLSVAIYSNLIEVEKIIPIIKTKAPNIKILLGGQAFNYGKNQIIEKYPYIYIIENLSKLEVFINQS